MGDKYNLLCNLAILDHSLFMSSIDHMHLLLGLQKLRLNEPLELNSRNDRLFEQDLEPIMSLTLVSCMILKPPQTNLG